MIRVTITIRRAGRLGGYEETVEEEQYDPLSDNMERTHQLLDNAYKHARERLGAE